MAWGGEDPEVYAGRAWHTDQGQHTFDFILCADQNLEAGRLNRLARQQAQPPVVFDRYEGLDRPPWGNSPPRSLWLASEQRAAADGRIPAHARGDPEIKYAPGADPCGDNGPLLPGNFRTRDT
jgi:alpha-mannosidase